MHHVPGEKTVVEPNQGMGIVADADEAFEPPVWRMQAVGRFETAGLKSGLLQQRNQVVFFVDADVSAGGGAVFPGKFPADAFREMPWYADGKRTGWLQDPMHFRKQLRIPGNVFENFREDDGIEGCRCDGQSAAVCLCKQPATRHLPSEGFMNPDPFCRLPQIVSAQIQPDDLRIRDSQHGADMPARAAADIENQRIGRLNDPIGFDGLHG